MAITRGQLKNMNFNCLLSRVEISRRKMSGSIKQRRFMPLTHVLKDGFILVLERNTFYIRGQEDLNEPVAHLGTVNNPNEMTEMIEKLNHMISNPLT